MPANIRFWFAFGLLLGAAVLLHAVSHGEPPVDTHAVASFPETFGAWRSQTVPIDKAIIEAIGVDDYVSRIYAQPNQAPVLLYIGYYKTQRTGVTIHSPKNCLPGSGWALDSEVGILRPRRRKQQQIADGPVIARAFNAAISD